MSSLSMRSLYIIVMMMRTNSLVDAEELQLKEYDVLKLADGVYGFVWKEPHQDPIEGNALFVINDRDVLVVDTGLLPSTARRMAGELKKLTTKPVRYVVNTHWHDDHTNGNEVYRDLWQGVEFIAHPDTRTDLFELTYKTRAKDVANIIEDATKFERWATEGKDDEGKPINDRRLKYFRETAALFRATAPELAAVRETPPDLLLTDQLVLQRGKRTIEIRWLGRGNTRGDVVVFLPEERIVATGDLLVHPIPFAYGSYYEEWIAALGKLDSIKADILFPGHGSVQRNRTYLHNVQGLLASLVNEVKTAVAAGATLEETQRKVTLVDWKATLAGDDQVKQRWFDGSFVAPAVERAWRQAKGEPDQAEGIK